jgi:ribose/xylose/arabinose/galactoside ABC-type transport system permease subunit
MATLSRPRSETPLPATVTSGRAKGILVTIFLLVIVGIASLIVAEQVATGWLPFGERTNIPRSNLNVLELIVMVGAGAWGIATLWTAIGLMTNNETPMMSKYFEGDHGRMTPGVMLTLVMMGVMAAISLIIAEQILTGWLPLGPRVNIVRSNLNGVEIVTIIATALLGLTALRTVLGLLQRDRRAWAAAQWMVLLVAVLGVTILLSGVFDIHTILPRGGTIRDNLSDFQLLTAPGLLIFLSCMAVYRFITIGVDTPPDVALRNRLALTPGAGGVIGFLFLFTVFALATDLFLEPRSLSGLLATNITRGIVAIGITFLMISGEFDLSVGSVFGVGALIFLLMMTEGLSVATLVGIPAIIIGLALAISGSRSGRTPLLIIGIGLVVGAFVMAISGLFDTPIITTVLPALLIALLFAGLLGFINGGILILTGIPSFIVTLGTLLAYRAILLVVVADGRILRLALVIGFMGYSIIRNALKTLRERISSYQSDTSDFRDFQLIMAGLRLLIWTVVVIAVIIFLIVTAISQVGQAGTSPILEVSFFDLSNGKFDFVPIDVNLRAGVMWWLILVIAFQFILNYTEYGNHVLAVGGNPGAARAQGINVNRVKITNFIICAMLAALAGIISVARLANVDPLMGDGLELEVIAASVIGGALLTGGYGSIVGALLGVLMFGMLQTGLVLVGVDARAFSGVIGIIIIVAVVINTAVRQQKK